MCGARATGGFIAGQCCSRSKLCAKQKASSCCKEDVLQLWSVVCLTCCVPVAAAAAVALCVQAGLEPTHQVVKLARDAGFSNVHDYLVHLVTGEAHSVQAESVRQFVVAAQGAAAGGSIWAQGGTVAAARSSSCTELLAQC
jgi:hypothetical protein